MIQDRVPSIIFVCTANIIRSPIAEVLLKQKIQQSGVYTDWLVESAGVQGMTGLSADLNAQTTAEVFGLNLSKHIARRITRSLVMPFDLIITMEQQHKEALQYAFPENKEKIFNLAEFVGLQMDIADPLSKPLEAYVRTLKTLNEILDKSFFQIILLTKYFSLKSSDKEIKFTENGQTIDVTQNVKNLFGTDAYKVVVEGSLGFPSEFRYKIMYLFLKLNPKDSRILVELQKLAIITPPSDEEHGWLKDIQLFAVVAPLSCRAKIAERLFIHPEIQNELDNINRILSEPTNQPIYQDLEALFHKKFPPDKYRFNIWDLTSKYDQLPYRVGDYEQAYLSLREKNF